MYIHYVLPDIEIVDFTLPERGFDYLKSEFFNSHAASSILLLDINMPTMTGWDFLEKYEELDQRVKDQISIYILSSSVDPRDKEKAANNKYVKGYLEKTTPGRGDKNNRSGKRKMDIVELKKNRT